MGHGPLAAHWHCRYGGVGECARAARARVWMGGRGYRGNAGVSHLTGGYCYTDSNLKTLASSTRAVRYSDRTAHSVERAYRHSMVYALNAGDEPNVAVRQHSDAVPA